MKNFSILIFLSLAFAVNAQQGHIKYKEEIKFDIDLPDDVAEQMKGMLPSSQVTYQSLFFTENESLYKAFDEASAGDQIHEAGSEDSDVQIKMVIARPENILYRNLEQGTVVEKNDFL